MSQVKAEVKIAPASVPAWMMGSAPVNHSQTPASDHCQHPERWSVFNMNTPEIEELKLIRSFVRTAKPEKVLIAGDYCGTIGAFVGQALRENGIGTVIIFEADLKNVPAADERIHSSGLGRFAAVANNAMRDVTITEDVDMIISDGDGNQREEEIKHFLPKLKVRGHLMVHDCFKTYIAKALQAIAVDNGMSITSLPTPRGLAIAQKL